MVVFLLDILGFSNLISYRVYVLIKKNIVFFCFRYYFLYFVINKYFYIYLLDMNKVVQKCFFVKTKEKFR